MPLTAELIATTLKNRSSAIADAIFTGSPLNKMLKAAGKIDMQGGGTSINRAVEYATNDTVASFSGTDVINTTKQVILTDAQYSWRYVAGTYMITVQEMAENDGDEKVISILDTRERNLIKSMQQKCETYAFAAQPASGSKDPESLTELVDVDPTGNPPRANVGAIDTASAVNTWWRNRTVPLDVDTARAVGGTYDFATNGLTYMRRMMNKCSQSAGMDQPKLIVATQELYEAYESTLPPQLVLGMRDRKAADLGFSGFTFRDATFTYSNSLTGGTGTTANKMYFLNLDYLYMVAHRDWNMKIGKLQEPTDQALLTAKVILAYNLICTNRKRQGVIEGFLV